MLSRFQVDNFVFYALFSVTLTSRILVLSQVVESSSLTIAIQLVYVGSLFIFWLHELKKGAYFPTCFTLFTVLLTVHAVLFSYVLVNPAMPRNLGIGRTFVLFLLVVLFTAWYIRLRNIILEFSRLCFYILGVVLLFQLLTNFQDLNLGKVLDIFDVSQRIRSVFGFGHPNTLGGLCITMFMIYMYIRSMETRAPSILIQLFRIGLLCISLVMLLCSASRSSIIGLLVLISVWALGTLSYAGKYSIMITLCSKLALGIAVLYVAFSMVPNLQFNALLADSNRITLFDHALPELFRSGRVLTGLGYVSNTSYGEGLTPYNTLWLDNSYAYYLVATGVIGLLLIALALVALFYGAISSAGKDSRILPYYKAVMYSYLFISLFEVVALAPTVINYFLIPLFLANTSSKKVRHSNTPGKPDKEEQLGLIQ